MHLAERRKTHTNSSNIKLKSVITISVITILVIMISVIRILVIMITFIMITVITITVIMIMVMTHKLFFVADGFFTTETFTIITNKY